MILAYSYLGCFFSKVGFFRRGLMIACQAATGKMAFFNDVLTISDRTGAKHVMCSFRSQVGIGSRLQDLFGDLRITFSTSSSVAGIKQDNGSKLIDTGSSKQFKWVMVESNSSQIFSILFVK